MVLESGSNQSALLLPLFGYKLKPSVLAGVGLLAVLINRNVFDIMTTQLEITDTPTEQQPSRWEGLGIPPLAQEPLQLEPIRPGQDYDNRRIISLFPGGGAAYASED